VPHSSSGGIHTTAAQHISAKSSQFSNSILLDLARGINLRKTPDSRTCDAQLCICLSTIAQLKLQLLLF